MVVLFKNNQRQQKSNAFTLKQIQSQQEAEQIKFQQERSVSEARGKNANSNNVNVSSQREYDHSPTIKFKPLQPTDKELLIHKTFKRINPQEKPFKISKNESPLLKLPNFNFNNKSSIAHLNPSSNPIIIIVIITIIILPTIK